MSFGPAFIQPTFPICAICNKPVDELTTTDNPPDRTFVITASCHGETETVAVPWTQIADAAYMSLGGVAFAPKTQMRPIRLHLLPRTKPTLSGDRVLDSIRMRRLGGL